MTFLRASGILLAVAIFRAAKRTRKKKISTNHQRQFIFRLKHFLLLLLLFYCFCCRIKKKKTHRKRPRGKIYENHENNSLWWCRVALEIYFNVNKFTCFITNWSIEQWVRAQLLRVSFVWNWKWQKSCHVCNHFYRFHLIQQRNNAWEKEKKKKNRVFCVFSIQKE